MRRFRIAAAILAALCVVGGCTTNQEAETERDRMMNELAEEKEALSRQLADTRATRELLEKQLGGKEGEIGSLSSSLENARREEERLRRELQGLRDNPVVVEKIVPAPVSGAKVNIDNPDIEVERRAGGDVVLRVNDRVTFTPGSATLTKGGQTVLTDVIKAVRENPDYRVSIEGHTDDTPLKKTKEIWHTNMNLSIARAQAVRNFLAQGGTIPEERMRVVGYGETRPLVSGATDDARGKNRRVEIVLYSGN